MMKCGIRINNKITQIIEMDYLIVDQVFRDGVCV